MRIEKFLTSSPLYWINVAYDQVLRDFQNRLKEEDVHFIQALILTGLFFEERPVRPSQLAKSLGCSRSNISHAIRDLETKGWLERAISPADARAYFLTLTRTGRRKAPRLIKLFDTTQAQIEAGSPRDLAADLRKFIAAYREIKN